MVTCTKQILNLAGYKFQGDPVLGGMHTFMSFTSSIPTVYEFASLTIRF